MTKATETIVTPVPVVLAPAVVETVPFTAEQIAARTGKKGYANKFFAELMPKFNELLELRTAYKAISGGVEAAKAAAIDGLTEESNPEMFHMLNDLAEAEEIVIKLTAALDEWADSVVAESTESPDEIKDKFAVIKSDVDKTITGAEDYFVRSEDVIEDEDGKTIADSEDGESFLKIKNELPTMRRGKGRKPGNQRGKLVREWVKANDVKGPEGQELGKVGVIAQWAFDAYDAANK